MSPRRQKYKEPPGAEDLSGIAQYVRSVAGERGVLLLPVYSGGHALKKPFEEALEHCSVKFETYMLRQTPREDRRKGKVEFKHRPVLGVMTDPNDEDSELMPLETAVGSRNSRPRTFMQYIPGIARVMKRHEQQPVAPSQPTTAVILDDDIHYGESVVGSVIYVLERQPKLGYDGLVVAVDFDLLHAAHISRHCQYNGHRAPEGNFMLGNPEILVELIRKVPEAYENLDAQGLLQHLFRDAGLRDQFRQERSTVEAFGV